MTPALWVWFCLGYWQLPKRVWVYAVFYAPFTNQYTIKHMLRYKLRAKVNKLHLHSPISLVASKQKFSTVLQLPLCLLPAESVPVVPSAGGQS